ncbi:MAG: J domain-containing protein [Marinoscillum sp.]
MTYYEILGVDSHCDYAAIKTNYRRLVKLYHPDVNSSAEAAVKIVEITRAYEVLSDPNARASYDWQLSLSQTPDIDFQYKPKPEPEMDERELHRREYVKWRRQKNQETWERQFHLKATFYKYQRYFAFLFLAVGMLFTYDYFVFSDSVPQQIDRVIMTKWGQASVVIGMDRLYTSSEFYEEFQNANEKEGYLHLSGVFEVPCKISLTDGPAHVISGTLHSFRNFFPYMIILISLGMIVKRKYSDVMLTLGLLPIFMILFLLAFLASSVV